ncbi:MAG: SOUL heme-binding protein [Bacteroidetes bacterium HGW-Bacteroidetes-15]|nr:MAG: SOUL heme-binding protein [Bacteroidetes bacterium HGW-Bacteroidetes-15]
MKTFIVVTAIAIILILVFQSFISMSASRTEEQKYTVKLKEKDFEIRFYPSTTVATINSSAKTYKDLSGWGFRKLAGYIFGGNETNTSIAMTAPVHMNINDSGSSMSFVMPSSYSEENLPKPNDPNVIIQQTADEYVAVISFSGYASDKDLKFYADKLHDILKEKGITSYGNTRYLGYNPPYQLINRRNEIVVSVEWKAE